MNLIYLVLLISTANGLTPRIIGGRDIKDGEKYPYMVSFRVNGSHKCGGTLLNHEWVMTAAHCLTRFNLSLDSVALVFGTNSLLNGGIAFRPESFHVNPDYNKERKTADIGLIKIKGFVEYSENIQPAALPQEDFLSEADRAGTSDIRLKFIGWGNTQPKGNVNDELQVIDLKIVDTSTCQLTFQSINHSNICTFTDKGEGICYGDSGSPLLYNGVQIAIGAWGSPCARGFPDVHTKVYSYLNWIKEEIS